jgi:hypothetical protein
MQLMVVHERDLVFIDELKRAPGKKILGSPRVTLFTPILSLLTTNLGRCFRGCSPVWYQAILERGY